MCRLDGTCRRGTIVPRAAVFHLYCGPFENRNPENEKDAASIELGTTRPARVGGKDTKDTYGRAVNRACEKSALHRGLQTSALN